MTAWPFSLPASVWIGLATAEGELLTANGYLRLPATLDAEADALVVNTETLSWPVASANWGTITAVLVFDQIERDTLVTATCPSIAVNRYGRARISAGDLRVTPGAVTVGYGRLSYGRGGYNSPRTASYQSVNFGLGGFGQFGYATRPVIAGQAIVSLTFERVFLCSPGTWTPAGCCEIKRAA